MEEVQPAGLAPDVLDDQLISQVVDRAQADSQGVGGGEELGGQGEVDRGYFTLWRQDGLDQRILEILRCQVRERSRRLEDPSLVIIDTQSVRVAAGVPKEMTGLDANKKTPGRKRGLAVDVVGLIIGAVILAASAGIVLLDQAAERCGMHLKKVLVDQVSKTP